MDSCVGSFLWNAGTSHSTEAGSRVAGAENLQPIDGGMWQINQACIVCENIIPVIAVQENHTRHVDFFAELNLPTIVYDTSFPYQFV